MKPLHRNFNQVERVEGGVQFLHRDFSLNPLKATRSLNSCHCSMWFMAKFIPEAFLALRRSWRCRFWAVMIVRLSLRWRSGVTCLSSSWCQSQVDLSDCGWGRRRRCRFFLLSPATLSASQNTVTVNDANGFDQKVPESLQNEEAKCLEKWDF